MNLVRNVRHWLARSGEGHLIIASRRWLGRRPEGPGAEPLGNDLTPLEMACSGSITGGGTGSDGKEGREA